MMMIGRRNQNEERFSAHKDDARLDFVWKHAQWLQRSWEVLENYGRFDIARPCLPPNGRSARPCQEERKELVV